MATKAQLKAAYIAALKARYPFYVEGSRPLQLANEAIDAALAGKMKLRGECFDQALSECGLPKAISLRALSALPE